MAQHIVKCRICHQPFDTESLSEDEWVMPNPRCYYHKSCFEDWKANKDNVKASIKDADFWQECLIDYLYRDVQMEIDFVKFKSQWTNFIKPNKYTPKGIYFAMRYYYDVLHGDPKKAQGGIGIINSIYNDAAQYWVDLENRRAGTIDAIIKQIEERKSRPVQKIVKTNSENKNKLKWKLEDVK